jgi:glycosyltransferase involved in cell wall biosynthesis
MGAPQARLYELATRLRDKGHTITVLTAMPNYPTGKVFDEYRKKIYLRKRLDGLRVIRTWIYPSKSSKTLPRLLSYMSFVCSSVALGIWNLGKQDVVLFESPPLFLVPSGLIIGRATGARIIMNVSDIWPDIIVRMGHTTGGPFLKAMEWLEKFGYEHSDVVALTNPGAMEQIKKRFPHVTTTVISNGADTQMFHPKLASQTIRNSFGAGSDDFLVAYCGLHGLAQGLEVIISAAEELKKDSHVKFIIIGDGPTKEDLVARAKQKQLTNLTFFDSRPKKEIPAILASCDVSLVPLLARLPGTMPSKVYEALSVGVPPIVAKGCEGDTLVSKFNAGRTFEPLDGKELANAILEMADNTQEYQKIRENALSLAKRFDRNIIAQRTEKILCAVADRKPLPDVSW